MGQSLSFTEYTSITHISQQGNPQKNSNNKSYFFGRKIFFFLLEREALEIESDTHRKIERKRETMWNTTMELKNIAEIDNFDRNKTKPNQTTETHKKTAQTQWNTK